MLKLPPCATPPQKPPTNIRGAHEQYIIVPLPILIYQQVQLKGRFKIQRLSVRIADAHGRLVKTIRLHYHSKPVASLTDLRMPENAAKWRLAASVQVCTTCLVVCVLIGSPGGCF